MYVCMYVYIHQAFNRKWTHRPSPLPIMTSCTSPVTPCESPPSSHPNTSSIRSTPFWGARRPMNTIRGVSGFCSSPSSSCSACLHTDLLRMSSDV